MQQTEKQVEWAIGGKGDGEQSRSKEEEGEEVEEEGFLEDPEKVE